MKAFLALYLFAVGLALVLLWPTAERRYLPTPAPVIPAPLPAPLPKRI